MTEHLLSQLSPPFDGLAEAALSVAKGFGDENM
jgi:hypothetical protein